MNFSENCLYHVYNRTFQSTRAFRSDRNYRYFIDKFSMLKPFCDLLAYCVMPDHFHLMVYVPDGSAGLNPLSLREESPQMQIICRKIGTLLSSYTQGFNNQERRVGSLFQPRTKSKQLDLEHALNCFYYIHENPVKALLVNRIDEWSYSSVHEYTGTRHGFCNRELASELFNLPQPQQFLLHSEEEARKSVRLETSWR